MKEFQRKRKLRRLLYSPLVLLVLLALLFVTGKALWGVYEKERESRTRLHGVEEELALLRAREAALKRKIERLQTPEGVEAEIREQFQVAKPGERMVVIVAEKRAEAAAPKGERSLVSRFFDIFR